MKMTVHFCKMYSLANKTSILNQKNIKKKERKLMFTLFLDHAFFVLYLLMGYFLMNQNISIIESTESTD